MVNSCGDCLVLTNSFNFDKAAFNVYMHLKVGCDLSTFIFPSSLINVLEHIIYDEVLCSENFVLRMKI